MNYKVILFVLLGAISSAIPAASIKQYIKTNSIFYIILAYIAATLLFYSYFNLFKFNDISIYYPILKTLAIIFIITFGVIYFSEKLTLRKILGTLLGIIAIFILSS